jgi:flagellar assembly protein FliH
MTPIIKRGTKQASKIQRILFTEDVHGLQADPVAQPPWLEALALPSAHSETTNKPASAPEPPNSGPDLAQLEKSAYENGFRQGEKAGMEIAERKVDAVMRRYAEAIFEIGKVKPMLYSQVEREVVKLALEVAKKIVHREIHADREIVQTLVKVALSHVADKSAVTIHVSPFDYEFLLERRAELSQGDGRDIALLSDKSIERGGCLIQTECGEIDARIDEEFREVEHAFFEGMK